jgi:hypothetical protein
MSTDELAVTFLQRYIDVPVPELEQLDITQCLSDLLLSVVSDTVELLTEEERVIH